MADRPARRKPALNLARVVRTQHLTPHMVRLVLGGGSLAGFAAGEWTDHYIKILFPVPGVTYPEPFDMDVIHRDLPRDQWPRMRSYTVRDWDPDALELTLDFVVHGDEGLAGPWALQAAPGDEVRFLGPGGGYAPSPDADWHLLAGDESALPAIAASLARVPAGAPVHAFIEVADRTERQGLRAPVGADVTWLFRNGLPVGTALVDAVRTLDFPPGQVHAFVHGEAAMVRTVRRHLRLERGVARERLSASGYWRLGHDDEGWRAAKKEWNEAVEAEQESAATEPATTP